MGISGGVVIFMQSFTLGHLLAQWESYGIFDWLLPFLLIFAIIFGVLSTTKILGHNQGIMLIISLVIALMALRLEFIPLFFAGLFPRFAMAMAAILVAMILTGLFIPQEKRALRGWLTAFGITAVVIAVIVVLQTFSSLNYFNSAFWQEYTSVIISVIAIIAVIVGIVVSLQQPKPEDKDPDRFKDYQLRSIRVEPHGS